MIVTFYNYRLNSKLLKKYNLCVVKTLGQPRPSSHLFTPPLPSLTTSQPMTSLFLPLYNPIISQYSTIHSRLHRVKFNLTYSVVYITKFNKQISQNQISKKELDFCKPVVLKTSDIVFHRLWSLIYKTKLHKLL